MQYSVKEAHCGGWIACHGGAEIGIAPTMRRAALVCAQDAIDADPEATLDVVYDVAAEAGQMVGNVKHMTWFVSAVADEIQSYWE